MTGAFSPLSVLIGASPALWVAVADTAIKATLVLLLAGSASMLLRRRSAALRHLIWTLGLAGALALPLLSLALPRWQVPLVTLPSADPAMGLTRVTPAPAVRTGRKATSGPHRTSAASGPISPSAGPEAAQPPAQGQRPDVSWTMLLAVMWAVGTLAILSRLAVGLLAVQWMSRRTKRVTDARWLPLARELAAKIGTGRHLTFLRSPRATMPMAWGIFRPSVLMPADADSWPDDRLRIVLLHELAHVKRRDCLTHALAQVACAVYWFNPLAWIAARHLRRERERACDDLVLASGTRGSDYAAQLLDVARVMRSGRFPALLTGATLAMAHRSQLEGRLLAILDPKVPRAGVSRWRGGLATAAMAGALVPLASLQPWVSAAPAAVLPAEHRAPAAEIGPRSTSSRAQRPVQKPAVARPTELARETGARAAKSAQTAQHPARANAVIEGVVQAAIQGAIQGALEGTWEGVVEGLTVHAARAAQVSKRVEETAERRATKKVDPAVVAALTAALKDLDNGVREAALHALAQLRDPMVFEPLVQALGDSSASVREQAALALGQLRDARALEPLTHALKDSNASVREQAVFALGQLRSPAALDAVVAALRDSSADVREQAAFGLGQLRDKRAVEPLISALKDPDADVREQAAFALGQLHDRTAVEALVVALKDSAADVREQVAFALGQLGDPRAVDALTAALKDQSASVREQAAFALGQLAR